MKQWIALAVVAPTLLLGVEKETCPFGPFDLRSPREQQASLYHQLSVTAEAVAPSGGRRRAVEPPPGGATYPASVNYVDTEIFGKMRTDGIQPAAISSDEEFLRRVTLDLTGQIPDPATVQAFLNDKSADKRTRTIDQLLASDGFVDRWTMWFGDLVQNVQVSSNSREFSAGRNAEYTWIHDSIKANTPYDQMVRDLLGANGDSYASGTPNYWVRQIQPNGPAQDTYDNLAAESGSMFLGMPMQCISCHNGLGHLEVVNVYLKSHSRYDFWGNAAFFSRGRSTRIYADPNNKNVYSWMLTDAVTGSYSLNTTTGNKSQRCGTCPTTEMVNPAFLMTGETPRPGEAWRDAYGRMLTANPQFARATVNYLWKEMFGLGIVEPTDNMDPARLDPNNLPAGQTLQPNHPNLLTLLANNFTTSHYDLRAMLRTMAMSNSYQLSTKYSASAWNESWTPYYARHIPRRLMAESLLDAVAKSTNVPVTYAISGGLPAVTSAMKLPDTLEVRGNVYGRFLDEFGRGNRDNVPRANDSSIAQALSLMNDGTVVVNRVHRATANSTVAKTLASTSDPNAIADQLYLSTLSRYPTATEKQQAVAYLKSGTLANKTEDLQWVLLNSLEFLFD